MGRVFGRCLLWETCIRQISATPTPSHATTRRSISSGATRLDRGPNATAPAKVSLVQPQVDLSSCVNRLSQLQLTVEILQWLQVGRMLDFFDLCLAGFRSRKVCCIFVVVCLSGEQRRRVVCVRKEDALIVSDIRCEASARERPPELLQKCNLHCSIRWEPLPFCLSLSSVLSAVCVDVRF